MNALRFAISNLIRTCCRVESTPTLIYIRLLRVFFRELVLHDDVLQPRLLEVLLARVFLSPVLGRILLHRFQLVLLSPLVVDADTVEKFVRLLAHLKQLVRWISTRISSFQTFVGRLTLTYRRSAIAGYIRSSPGRAADQGIAQQRCTPVTTYRSKQNTAGRAEPRAIGRIGTGYTYRQFASRDRQSRSR